MRSSDWSADVDSSELLYIVNWLMVYIVLALGRHIVIGETGQFAVSHAALYGIGTYTAGILTTVWNVNFLVALAAATLLPAVVGYVLGALAISMRDTYLALSPFAFGEAMQCVFANWDSVTRGSNAYHNAPDHFLCINRKNIV